MAGDWIKVEINTPDKPEVLHIAEILDMDPENVFAKLFRVWVWFDQMSENGHAPKRTFVHIDRATNTPGFGQAMVDAGWLIDHGETIELPHFEYHNGKNSKKRALDARRKKRGRKNVRDMSAYEPDKKADNSVTREEKSIKQVISSNGTRVDTSQNEQLTGYIKALAAAGFRNQDVHDPVAMAEIAAWHSEGYTAVDVAAACALAKKRLNGDYPPRSVKYLSTILRSHQPGQVAAGSTKARPNWTRVPRDNEELEKFAVANGFSRPKVAESYEQYRGRLQNEVEARRAVEGLS